MTESSQEYHSLPGSSQEEDVDLELRQLLNPSPTELELSNAKSNASEHQVSFAIHMARIRIKGKLIDFLSPLKWHSCCIGKTAVLHRQHEYPLWEKHCPSIRGSVQPLVHPSIFPFDGRYNIAYYRWRGFHLESAKIDKSLPQFWL